MTIKKRREDLQDILESICPHVYFQPPESLKMIFPCIVYARNSIKATRADNSAYLLDTAYSMRYISKSVDDETVERLALLPKCRHTGHYAKDNLHHDSYEIYY